MRPSQLSAELRRIASAIEASENPDRRLVAGALARVVTKLAAEGQTSGAEESEKYEAVEQTIDGMFGTLKKAVSENVNKVLGELKSMDFSPEEKAKVVGAVDRFVEKCKKPLDIMVDETVDLHNSVVSVIAEAKKRNPPVSGEKLEEEAAEPPPAASEKPAVEDFSGE